MAFKPWLRLRLTRKRGFCVVVLRSLPINSPNNIPASNGWLHGAGQSPVEEGEGLTIDPIPRTMIPQRHIHLIADPFAPFRPSRAAPVNSRLEKRRLDTHPHFCILDTMDTPLKAARLPLSGPRSGRVCPFSSAVGTSRLPGNSARNNQG